MTNKKKNCLCEVKTKCYNSKLLNSDNKLLADIQINLWNCKFHQTYDVKMLN